jgi:hypothetical protein
LVVHVKVKLVAPARDANREVVAWIGTDGAAGRARQHHAASGQLDLVPASGLASHATDRAGLPMTAACVAVSTISPLRSNTRPSAPDRGRAG